MSYDPKRGSPIADLYHGLTYEQHRALMVQRSDGSWWCPQCEEACGVAGPVPAVEYKP